MATNPAILCSIGYDISFDSPLGPTLLYLKNVFLNRSTSIMLTLWQSKIRLRCFSHSSVKLWIDLVFIMSSMNYRILLESLRQAIDSSICAKKLKQWTNCFSKSGCVTAKCSTSKSVCLAPDSEAFPGALQVCVEPRNCSTSPGSWLKMQT